MLGFWHTLGATLSVFWRSLTEKVLRRSSLPILEQMTELELMELLKDNGIETSVAGLKSTKIRLARELGLGK